MDMSHISTCNMSDCVYNKDSRCRTPGITVGSHAECNTFSHASARGGRDNVMAGVGACLAAGCKYNDMLECKSPNIEVATHDRHPDCMTFQSMK
jgi:hypothetical protein